MKIKRKIYVVGPSIGYANWTESELVKKMEDADLVMFTGGEDVSASLYFEPSHPSTNSNYRRDAYEVEESSKALKLKKKMIGICRGSQFLCVMAGGKLMQHMNHPFTHNMTDLSGKIISVNSSHHQCQFPFNLSKEKYKILGWAKNISKYHFDGNKEEMSPPVEPEVVFYPKINALAVQSHPEWLFGESEVNTTYFQNLLDEFMDGKL